MKKLTNPVFATHCEAGRKWLDELPVLIRRLTERWQITGLQEYQNLSWNFVAKGHPLGRQVALKISYDLPSLESEVNALRVFPAGSGVEVMRFDADHKAVLLEAACPGRDLMSYKSTD